MENMVNDTLLEQLRNDYSALKERVEKQEIINDRLMNSVFKTKMKSINSVAWTSVICGVFTILVAPFAFHYSSVMRLSWAFVIGTDILMLACIGITWYYHSSVRTPAAGESIVSFAQSVKLLKKRYKNWTGISVLLIAVWLSWMLIELFAHTENIKLAIAMTAALTVGVISGGILGLSMNRKVISACDEILNAIEE